MLCLVESSRIHISFGLGNVNTQSLVALCVHTSVTIFGELWIPNTTMENLGLGSDEVQFGCSSEN